MAHPFRFGPYFNSSLYLPFSLVNLIMTTCTVSGLSFVCLCVVFFIAAKNATVKKLGEVNTNKQTTEEEDDKKMS